MRLNVILRFVGLMLMLNALFMLLSAFIAMLNGFDTSFYPLLLSFLLTSILGTFPLIFVSGGDGILTKEGYMIVVCSWLVSCFMGTLPYVLWGGEFNFTNAWFEAVSGFTTTGSTILNDVEALPKGLLFWRSSTHWLGGMGVVLFALVVLPSIGQTKAKLSSMEISSVAKDNFKYRTQKILQILLVVYIGLTAAETVLLKIAGMSWFDAVNHSFSTIATGGLSTKNLSIAYYNSVWIDTIIIVFMLASGLHFGLIFTTLTGKSNNIFKSEVSRYYLWCIIISSVAVALSLWTEDIYTTFFSSLRYGMFQVVSVASTTGFATADSNVWTPFAIIIIMLLSIQCACAGSTSGGMKCDRALLSFKAIKTQILQRQHPNAVIRVKMNGVIQDNTAVNMAVLFVTFYLMLIGLGTILGTLFGIDLTTSFSMIVASIGNVGPGFGEVGSMANYGGLPIAAKYLCTIFMLLGRLEIFGIIQLFLIGWWK